MSSEDVVWEDPPPGRYGGRAPWEERFAPLREHPGKWARFGPMKSVSQVAYQLANGARARDLDRSNFEFVGRTVDGEGFLFVRFIGDES